MSISSDIYITREQAEMLVKNMMMADFLQLVKVAVKNMEDHELTSKLHTDIYFYNIEENE